MTFDGPTVTVAVEAVQRMLRADGAELILVDADPKTARIRMRLELDGVDCADCVLPPDMLQDTIEQSLRTRLPGEFELVLDDPRRDVRAGPGT
jgi:Fe-S cluster biogenesis protein NfuA